MRGSSARRARAQGFTLVELLVAITLLSLLTVMLFGGFRFGTRAAGAVGARIDQSAQIAQVYDFMQNALTDARIIANAGNALAAPDFEGRADEISFVTVPPAYLALGGFHRLTIALAGDGRANRLMLSWQQFPRGSLTGEPVTLQPSILLDKVAKVEFAYFGVAEANRAPEWQDRWVGRAELPQLIRLRITMPGGWRAPDLIVAPRLAEPVQS